MLDLSTVPTAMLERLRELVIAKRLELPVSEVGLRLAGLGSLAEHAAALAAFDGAQLAVVIEALLAERFRGLKRPLELVWTGPDSRTSLARDTAVVVRALFQDAKTSVTVAGFRFDHGSSLLAPLHEAMRDRGVQCCVYGDTAEAKELVQRNWPFGPPWPEVYGFVPPAEVYASLHAKCVVVDHRLVLVTSANFTERGQERNVEVGVLADDSRLAEALEGELHAAASAGHFAKIIQ